jgi:hypothetical protein
LSRRCNHAGVGWSQSAEGAIMGNNAGRRAAFCRSSSRTPAVGVADHCAMPWLSASDAGYRMTSPKPRPPPSHVTALALLCFARVGASGQAALLIPRFCTDEQSGLTSPMLRTYAAFGDVAPWGMTRTWWGLEECSMRSLGEISNRLAPPYPACREWGAVAPDGEGRRKERAASPSVGGERGAAKLLRERRSTEISATHQS